ncbi:MAG: NAD(P)H-dependent glycerol-3-phosphate dehydrogenase [Thermoplasmatota archaeon]
MIEGQKDVAVAVIGSGGFGTCLSSLLASNGLEVRQWCRSPEYAQTLTNRRENVKYLPGVKLPLNVWITSSLQDAVAGAEVVVMAVPSQAVRPTAQAIAPFLDTGAKILNVAKGIETGTFLRMSEVLTQELPNHAIASLSGPNHAEEIARGMPGATVIASKDAGALNLLCDIFSTQVFKAYPRRDVIGVELGGVLKNIVAIASGVTTGIGYGDNSASAVITLGLDEMTRFGTHHGAKARTFTGLSGLGDLIATATSEHSRNRRLGELVGRGLSYQEALKTMGGKVAEGVNATKFVHEQALAEGIPLPLTAQIHHILYDGKDVREAVGDLLRLL